MDKFYTDNSNDRPYSDPNKEVKKYEEKKTSHDYLRYSDRHSVTGKISDRHDGGEQKR